VAQDDFLAPDAIDARPGFHRCGFGGKHDIRFFDSSRTCG
jgi:hypothetical protein